MVQLYFHRRSPMLVAHFACNCKLTKLVSLLSFPNHETKKIKVVAICWKTTGCRNLCQFYWFCLYEKKRCKPLFIRSTVFLQRRLIAFFQDRLDHIHLLARRFSLVKTLLNFLLFIFLIFLFFNNSSLVEL